MTCGAVNWSTKLQPIVTLSTTEAEYVAAVEAGKEIAWMRNLLMEIGYNITTSSVLHMDNNSAISVAKNPEHFLCLKHMQLRLYWLCNQVENTIIQPKFYPIADTVVECMVQTITRHDSLYRFIRKLGSITRHRWLVCME